MTAPPTQPPARSREERHGDGSRTRQAEAAVAYWMQTRSDAALADLCRAHDKLARYHARRFWKAARGDFEDFHQEARIGLVNAAKTYQSERGVSFTTFASACMVRQILHYLRDRFYSLKAPAALVPLEKRLRLEPDDLTDEQLAAKLGVTVRDVQDARPLWERVRPAQYPLLYGDKEDSWHPSAEDPNVAAMPERLDLDVLLADLPYRYRVVIRERFLLGRTQAQAGEALGVCQMQASRLEKQALVLLRRAAR